MPLAYTHKPRTYLHFDPPPAATSAEALATAPDRVARHAFYPFLGFSLTTPKVQKGASGEFIRKDKKRPIKLAAHMDAAIYAHYGRIIAEAYEAEVTARGLGECIIAFRRPSRPGQNNISFAHEVFEFIDHHRPCVAVGLDVEKFFDRLGHDVLKQCWQATLRLTRLPPDHFNLFKSLTDFTWVDRTAAYRAAGVSPHNPKPKDIRRTRICSPQVFREKIRGAGLIWRNPEHAQRRGIPQGAPISALLSNIYMLEFDTAMQAAVSAHGGLYRRYCDDIVVVVPPSAQAEIEALAIAEITALELTINPSKTTRATFPAGIGTLSANGDRTQFLGFDYDGVRTLIRASSLTRYYGKMRRGVQMARLTQRKHNKIEAAEGRPPTGLKTRQLYIRYSYLIHRRFRRKESGHDRQSENFITYAYRAAKTMGAPEIKRQVCSHLAKLKEAIRRAEK